MRITTDTLLKIANDFINRRSRSERDILAVYGHGSWLSDTPMLGGAADIDLFFIHNQAAMEEREIIRLTEDIHLDVAHHSRDLYRQTKELRLHPWLGPAINGCKILYDPQHFLDFAQASVRGQFNLPDNALKRARRLVEQARQLWLSFQFERGGASADILSRYLRAVEYGANAIAGLSGAPLTERRFLLNFPERANAVRRPGLYAGLLGLIGGAQAEREVFQSWLEEWAAACLAIPPDHIPARLHPHRLGYYSRSFKALLESELPPQVVLWPLLRTWTKAIELLPAGASQKSAWQVAGEHLGLLGEVFAEKVLALDAYLDTIEESLEAWGKEKGA